MVPIIIGILLPAIVFPVHQVPVGIAEVDHVKSLQVGADKIITGTAPPAAAYMFHRYQQQLLTHLLPRLKPNHHLPQVNNQHTPRTQQSVASLLPVVAAIIFGMKVHANVCTLIHTMTHHLIQLQAHHLPPLHLVPMAAQYVLNLPKDAVPIRFGTTVGANAEA